jgi:predicted PolB exonuclease-like 3'-5' exonuclease
MELLHFDIETVGNYESYDDLKLSDERGANLFEKKYIKRKWDQEYEDINDAYVNNAGIISTYGRIVCISFGYISENGKQIRSFYGENEKDILNSFNELLKKIQTKAFNLAGFRIKHFDIPWILHKLHKYNIVPADIIYLYDKKPWENRIVDMANDWKQFFAWSSSFDEMCYELNVESPKENLDGSKVHENYWKGDINSIKEYCEKDVSSSIDCSLKIYSK